MKALIYIKAPSNCGKTEIINEIWNDEKYLKSLGFIEDENFQIEKRASGNEKYKDILMVVRRDEITVGISSCGDPVVCHETSLDKLAEYGCDLIICACRTRGKTLKKVYEMISKKESKDYSKYGFIPFDNNSRDNKENTELFFAMIKCFLEKHIKKSNNKNL